jgi:hypothetical protein
VLAIVEDDRGWLWMSCSRGIFRVRKRDLDELDQKKIKKTSSIAYGKADGMESTICNGVAQPAAWKSHDGRLWFRDDEGANLRGPRSSAEPGLATDFYRAVR